jgi:hypothetical protein
MFRFILNKVVYLPDVGSNAYVPLRSPAALPSHIFSGGEIETWRPEWESDYNRRYRYNNTRVQRKTNLQI